MKIGACERTDDIEARLDELVQEVWPGARVRSVCPLGPDADLDNAAGTEKAIGYGVPLRIQLDKPDGTSLDLCLHTAHPDDFGHDRRADRAANMLLSYDSFGRIPRHTRALDVGAVGRDGRLVSLREVGEFYLVTEFAPGHVYAEDLRRIARDRALAHHDLGRARALAHLLAEIHAVRGESAPLYLRSIRDLVGHGEGIFGLVDAFPEGVAMAPRERLNAIESRCLEWRHRLRSRVSRLARTHGDFHPFNILFEADDTPVLLDTSRGSAGDPADDVICLSLNYIFFALEAPGSWRAAFGPLYRAFFQTYLERTGDMELFAVAAPFLAWRALVMTNPRWYPSIQPNTRDVLLGFVERVLCAPRFDLEDAERLFP